MTNTTHRSPHLNSTFAAWTQALLWISAGLAAVVAVLALVYRQTLTDWFDGTGSLDEAISIEETFVNWSTFVPVVFMATVVLLIIWLAKAHTATTTLLGEGEHRRYSRAWSIGVWFIPLANVISTPQIFAENQQIADAPRTKGRISGDWRSTPIRLELIWWWILFVGGAIFFRLGLTASIDDPEAFDKMLRTNSIDDYSTGLLIAALGGALFAAGTVCGAIFIRHVSNRLSTV